MNLYICYYRIHKYIYVYIGLCLLFVLQHLTSVVFLGVSPVITVSVPPVVLECISSMVPVLS